MRLYLLIPFVFAAMFMISPMANSPFAISDSEAHAPTSVAVTAATSEDMLTITWVHAAATACGADCSGLDHVDILRVPGQAASVNYTTLVGNSTAYVVVNNMTGALTWTDHSLAQGTQYKYTVCHPDPAESDCSADTTNAAVFVDTGDVTMETTLGSEPTLVTLIPRQTEIDVIWAGHATNNTDVRGLEIKYTSDGATYTTATSNSSTAFHSITPQYTITGLTANTTYSISLASVTEINSGSSGNIGGSFICANCGDVRTLQNSMPSSNPSPQLVNYLNGEITNNDLKVTLYENKGWDRILNTVLYTNINADQGIGDSDTYITWNFFNGVSVTDPHGYFNDVNVVAEQSGVRTQDFTYDITWNKPLAKSAAVLESSDFQSKTGATAIGEGWKTFPVTQVSHEIPEETSDKETIAMLWNEGVMNHVFLANGIDYALVSDKQYFIQDESIDVSQDEVVLEQEEGVIELFEDTTFSQESIKIGSKYIKTLVVSGTVNAKVFSIGNAVTFNIIGPDGSESKINAVTTSDRTFEVPIILEGLKSGTYQLVPVHDIHTGETLSFRY